MEKLLSIIVPVYNAEKYLNRSIRSLINQTYPNIEILLVNDGSQDKSLDLCREYANSDKRIKVINKKNRGPSLARRKGYEKSQGSYIMFLDSDDWLELDACEYLINLIEKFGSDIACCNYCINNDLDNKRENTYSLQKDEIIKDYFSFSNIKSCVWNKIYKKNVINSSFFEANINNGEDVLFTCRVLLNCNKVSVSNIQKIHYNTENVSLTRTNLKKKQIDDIYYAHTKQIEIIESDNVAKLNGYDKSIEKLYNALIELYNLSVEEKNRLFNKYIYSLMKNSYNKYDISSSIETNIQNKMRLILRHSFIYNKLYYIKKNKFYSMVYLIVLLICLALILFPFYFKIRENKKKNYILEISNELVDNYSVSKDNFEYTWINDDKTEFVAYRDGYCITKLKYSHVAIDEMPLSKCSLDSSRMLERKLGTHIKIEEFGNQILYNYVLYGDLNIKNINKDVILSYEDLDNDQEIIIKDENNKKVISYKKYESLRGFNGTYDYISYHGGLLIRNIGKIKLNKNDSVKISKKSLDKKRMVEINHNNTKLSLNLTAEEFEIFEKKYKDLKNNDIYVYYKLKKSVSEQIKVEEMDINNNLEIFSKGFKRIDIYHYSKD